MENNTGNLQENIKNSAIISIGSFYVLSSCSLCSYTGLPLSDAAMMSPLTLKCRQQKCFQTILQVPASHMHSLWLVYTVVFGCDSMQRFHPLLSDRKFPHLQKNKATIPRLWHFVNIAQNFLSIHGFKTHLWSKVTLHLKVKGGLD